MWNSHNNKNFSIILHVTLDFKNHLRLEYYSGFCIWVSFPKWYQGASLTFEALVHPDQKSLFILPRSQNSITNHVKQANVCCQQWLIFTLAENLAAWPKGFFQPDHSASLQSTFSSLLQCILFPTPFLSSLIPATSPPYNFHHPQPVGY